ncbi:endo-1,3(4)-beta-glucanase [Trifolium repens]|nr:endo-1,3(4)-beta-glucanase [Trifolium repens]
MLISFGFGIYNDHHYHLGYFLYGIAVLAKIDPIWGIKYKPQAYSLMEDFMNLSRNSNSNYTRLRCFELFKLHSWAGGLTEFGDGRNQESTSEAVNAYYSAALIGMAYDDAELVATASTLTSLEILVAEMWWHVKEGANMYEKDFTKKNKIIGVLWSNKRDSGLWFGPAEWKECRLGIQLLPLLPISEVLFSNVDYVKELVEWTLTALNREGVKEGWKGFVYALEAIYDNESALEKIRKLKGFDDGNSLTNLLWWIHSRADNVEDKVIKLFVLHFLLCCWSVRICNRFWLYCTCCLLATIEIVSINVLNYQYISYCLEFLSSDDANLNFYVLC